MVTDTNDTLMFQFKIASASSTIKFPFFLQMRDIFFSYDGYLCICLYCRLQSNHRVS